MLKQLYLYVVMAVLFAFSQAGIVTHEISHYNDHTQQSQPDKKQHGNEICTLCLSFAHAVGALPATALVFHAVTASDIAYTALVSAILPAVQTAYAARAPPAFIHA